MSPLIKILVAACLLMLVLTGLFWVLAIKGEEWWHLASTNVWLDLYQKNVRTPAFSALVTMGSFLLALKTNILARIKESYDTGEYRDVYRSEKKKNPAFKYYGTLENLGKAIGLNVILCLLTATMQMTLGFWWNAAALAICCGFAATTIALLFYLTLVLMSAHSDWFKAIEEQKQKEIAKLDKDNKEAEVQVSSDTRANVSQVPFTRPP